MAEAPAAVAMAEAPAAVAARPVRIDAGLLSSQGLAGVLSRCASLLRRGAVRLWCPGLGEVPRKFASARSVMGRCYLTPHVK